MYSRNEAFLNDLNVVFNYKLRTLRKFERVSLVTKLSRRIKITQFVRETKRSSVYEENLSTRQQIK